MKILSLSNAPVRILLLSCLVFRVWGSFGDRLPEFKDCVNICIGGNCHHGSSSIPFHLRLLAWTCSANCDYICQHVITDQRVSQIPAIQNAVVQYHGKWPFHRFVGIQEPFSVLFSFMNFMAHRQGMKRIRTGIPAKYSLRPYYIVWGYFGLSSWIFSMIFHTRDFNVTEKLDYFAAGASVLYGFYYTPIRIFRMDMKTPLKQFLLRLWTVLCVLMFIGHVTYLSFWRWDYTYNMAANVAAGSVQNILWIGFSIINYQKVRKIWAIWPALIVLWISLAMSLELFDFAPFGGMIDAHSLWHLGTVIPTIWWYSFLIKDAQQDMAKVDRLKA